MSISASDHGPGERIVVMTFHDRDRSATARVVCRLAGTEAKGSIAVWRDDQPQRLTFASTAEDARVLTVLFAGTTEAAEADEDGKAVDDNGPVSLHASRPRDGHS